MNVSTMSTAPTDANGGADALAAASATAPRSAWSHTNVAEIVPTLPLETRWPAPSPLRLYGGFWLPEVVLRTGIAAVHTCFEPRSTDIFLASYPKSGTTWLKALAFATLNRDTHSPFDADHPLRHRNPHDCVRFVEGLAFANNTGAVRDELETLPSPRALATHLPYSLLPERITEEEEEGLGCRILYICRNPKDALVSAWFFFRKTSSAMGVDARSFTLQEAFELFCEGISAGGPQWLHVLQYWEQSQRRPDKVLFLRYEEMLREPVRNLKKMAKFMGCGFSKEEEGGGVVHGIMELCSMDELKNMEVNKNGYTQAGTKSDSFFRKGTIGDWNDHMSPEMAERLDKIVEDALQGSGFSFADSLIVSH